MHFPLRYAFCVRRDPGKYATQFSYSAAFSRAVNPPDKNRSEKNQKIIVFLGVHCPEAVVERSARQQTPFF
jgi:hypothetical protein